MCYMPVRYAQGIDILWKLIKTNKGFRILRSGFLRLLIKSIPYDDNSISTVFLRLQLHILFSTTSHHRARLTYKSKISLVLEITRKYGTRARKNDLMKDVVRKSAFSLQLAMTMTWKYLCHPQAKPLNHPWIVFIDTHAKGKNKHWAGEVGSLRTKGRIPRTIWSRWCITFYKS